MLRIFAIGLIGIILSGCVLIVDPSDPRPVRIVSNEPPPALRPSKQVIRDIAAKYERLEKEHRPSRIQVIGTLPSNATFTDESVLSKAMHQVENLLIAQGIDREDIDQKKVVDDNAPSSGRVDLAPLQETTHEISFRPRPSKPAHKEYPPVREISESKVVTSPLRKQRTDRPFVKTSQTDRNNTASKTARSTTLPTSTTSPPISQSKQNSLPLIPESDEDSRALDIEKHASKDDIFRREGPTKPLIPTEKSGTLDTPITFPGSETHESARAEPPTFVKEDNRVLPNESPRLPETAYFGGYPVEKRPDLVIRHLSSPSNANIKGGGIIETAHAGSNLPPPNRCIDGRLRTSTLVERDEFRVGFDPGIYFYSGNHHKVYLSPVWLSDDEPWLTDRISISGYDTRAGRAAKTIFEFETDTEIYLIDSYILFRSYPVDPMGAPVLCVDAWISLENPGKNGKATMYYRHNGAIYEYKEVLLRRLSSRLYLRRGAP
uniref:Uncharacterized protein n=1 Tax=Candidatus Kentrum sp. DK TaxID=2126562 RepID=A0A450S2H8_9GAMM|nr:MAG: hypothetical protein BECKDK2373B_GA0170837_101141 [Candidatus Kentron sp. DK]